MYQGSYLLAFHHHYRIILLAILFLHHFSTVNCTVGIRFKEKQILDQIIGDNNYDSRIRPAGNKTKEGSDIDGPANVSVNIFVRSISRIDDVAMEYAIQITFREEWNDNRLVYHDPAFEKGKFLTLTDPNKIWKPDLFFSNEKKGHLHDIIMPNVLLRIYPNGNVLYSVRISLVLFCPMDLKYYPLDIQTCQIKMASYGYTTEDLVFNWKEKGPVQVTTNLHLPRFTLKQFNTNYCTSKTNTGEYSCINVDLIFKREFSYYLIQIYIPCSMLVIVSWVSFWLDPNAIPARVSLGVTTLLTMATQISGINASLPPVSYTKAIDIWTGLCLTFVFGALLEFALVNYASRSDAHRAAQKKIAQSRRVVDIEQVTFEAENLDVGPTVTFSKQQPLIKQLEELAERLRNCEIHSEPPTPSCFTKWLRRFPTRSKRIDVISRIMFPLLFVIFNFVYWFTYLLRDDLKEMKN
uniref:Glutamate-gated chloride ion channel n=1 Tax=Polyphagotarsonemus latus TaxID=1204166 RepID=A0AAN0N823_9ACAR